MSRLFSLIYQGQVHTTSQTKVIPQEDFAHLMEASAILEKAKEDAQKCLELAEEEAKTLKEEAKQAGFEEGLLQLNEQILHLDQEKKHLRHEMNQLILPLALKAAKKIVAKELQTKPETIVEIIMQALLPVLQNRHITIWVCKADKEILETEKHRIKETLERVETLLVRERDDISQGGCIIETENGIINATLEIQWKALEAAFERYGKS
jgi:type III secretion protein L